VQGDDWHSLAVVSDGSYGVPEGLICSFPTRFNGTNVEIVQGVELDEFSRQKVDASVAELQEEKSMVQELLP
jgi:malate dehydrogenase